MPDWVKIKTEYLTTGISQRKLAAKHHVSFNTLKDRARREHWSEQREQSQHNIATRTLQKAEEAVANRAARSLAYLDEATEALSRGLRDRAVTMAEEGNKSYELKVNAEACRILRDLLREENPEIKSDDPLMKYLEEMKKA